VARVPQRPVRRKDDFEGLWFITFADLMVQLMAFFAVIYSFSARDQYKLQQVLQSFQHELGVQKDGILPGSLGIDPARAADLEKHLSDLKPVEGEDVGVRMRIVSFRGAVLFEEGSAEVPAVFLPLLTRIGDMSREYPGFTLVCEGHAAPGERDPRGGDALALSGERAQAVVRFLDRQGVDPASMAAEAHGDSQVDGDPRSPEGRALQRRVRFRFQRVAER
jgi:flagellar motor protein MotB